MEGQVRRTNVMQAIQQLSWEMGILRHQNQVIVELLLQLKGQMPTVSSCNKQDMTEVLLCSHLFFRNIIAEHENKTGEKVQLRGEVDNPWKIDVALVALDAKPIACTHFDVANDDQWKDEIFTYAPLAKVFTLVTVDEENQVQSILWFKEDMALMAGALEMLMKKRIPWSLRDAIQGIAYGYPIQQVVEYLEKNHNMSTEEAVRLLNTAKKILEDEMEKIEKPS